MNAQPTCLFTWFFCDDNTISRLTAAMPSYYKEWNMMSKVVSISLQTFFIYEINDLL